MNNNQDMFKVEDIEKNKTMAGLAYLIFFLPLIVCPESKFGRFHANQSLLLWLMSIIGGTALGFVPFIGGLAQSLLSLFVLIIGIRGLMNGLNGKAIKLPLIGEYTLIK